MIELEVTEKLIKAINEIYYPPKQIGPASANAHILFDQSADNCLTLTAYGWEGSWLQRTIKATGLVGTKFLVLASELLRVKNLPSDRPLLLKQEVGCLKASTIDSFDNSGKPIIRHSINLNVFHGSIDEFGPAIFDQDKVATVKADDLKVLVSYLNEYGAYAKDALDRLVYLTFDKENQRLKAYGMHKDSQNFYLHVTIPAFVESDCKVVIKGRYLDAISFSGETVDILTSEKSVTFVHEAGRIRVLQNSLDTSGSITSSELYFSKEIVTMVNEHGWRSISLKEGIEALEAQLPAKDAQNRSIKLAPDNCHLVLSKVIDIRGSEFSRIVVTDPGSLPTEWETLSYYANSLAGTMEILKRFRKQAKAETDEIVLRQYWTQTKYGRRWMVDFRLLEDSITTTAINCRLVAICRSESETKDRNEVE